MSTALAAGSLEATGPAETLPDRQGPSASLAALRAWVGKAQPEMLVLVHPPPPDPSFRDIRPTLAIGIAETFPILTETGESRPQPAVPGHPLAESLARALVAADFDLAIRRVLPLPQEAAGALRLLGPPWVAPVVPIAVNTSTAPLPRPARLFALGRALRHALPALPSEGRVLILAVGGLAQGPAAGSAGGAGAPAAAEFLDPLLDRPALLAARSAADFAAGPAGVEGMIWLAMRAALPPQVVCRCRIAHAPHGALLALLLLEPEPAGSTARGAA
ncbi:MAG: hypothetical protein NZN45_06600 [Rhodovarius sp.]|nr:hypothetical protein [Rhodovarius sp.]